MKTILLSFDPQYYEPLKNGSKKFEYRSRFADEEIKAYLYLTSPVREIVAIVYFGKRKLLEDMKRLYAENDALLHRIDEYTRIFGKKYAVPIQKIEFLEPISLHAIRESIPGFMPPRSYMLLKEDSELDTLLKAASPTGRTINIDHSHILPNEICVD